MGESTTPGADNRKDSVSDADQWILYALGQLDSRLVGIDKRLEGIEKQLEGIEKRLRWIERPLWTVLGGVAVLIAILKL